MERFFIGSDCHDDMLGNDDQLKLQYRYRISKSLYEAAQSAVKREPCDVELPPVVKILLYEYEELKRRSKRLEILERAFLKCQKSEFEEFNDYPNCSFVSDKKQKEVE